VSITNLSTLEGIKATGQSHPSPGKVGKLSEADRVELGWLSFANWDFSSHKMRERESKIKQNADRPSCPASPPIHAALTPTHLYFMDDSEPRVLDVVGALKVGLVVPKLVASVVRGPRSRASPVESLRSSPHGKGLTEGPILNRAILRSIEKDPGTSKSISNFSIL
jgi:hypothetical protein